MAAARRIPVRYAKAAAPLDTPKRREKRDERVEDKSEKHKRGERKKREERLWKSRNNEAKLPLG